MPFGKEFDDVYLGFIEPVLEEAGFTVGRADNIESQQNILRDIVEKIDQSTLIIADLTGANPNVFYELGLAHAIRRPVILITQSVSDVPFDLKSYRLLEYSTHFLDILKAKEQLASYARGCASGTLKFGSPVTDFHSGEPIPNHPITPPQSDVASEDDRGFIDHLLDLNAGYDGIAAIAVRMTGDLDTLNKSLEDATEEFTRINANPNQSSSTAVRRVSRRLAERVGHFHSQLKRENDEYAKIAQDTEDSLEFVVSFQHELSTAESDLEKRRALISSLQDFLHQLVGARDSLLGLASDAESLPRLERRLNRELVQASEEMFAMSGNLDKTIASISRVLTKFA